ncbi:DUF7701 domain-containing protein [Cellulomonas phragmiteti]|uniref:DUF7701 domain-containing protein n=1 Tax=Cellulomonas phragmiteti TaxID=478780 RepID=A0ABQ4DMZ8_9CELL|nr:hypothetical protein [Cellulomonas phragmiteti]GIG40737.1 hypothetical protein Cph01nite_24990 [Cellulomonas phragmiteti]
MYLDDVAAAVRTHIPSDVDVPPDSEHLFLLYAVLVRAKGRTVTDEDVHDAWVAWMRARGEDHDAMVPFAALSESARAQDVPFAEAIRRAASDHPDAAS